MPVSKPAPSLAGRAALTLALMIGFYVLALAIVAGLLWIPYAQVAYANRILLKPTLACLAGAGIILWAILPRWDRFTPPGPRLHPQEQPDLFRELRTIADATGQAMPAEVYLVPEVNAWVTERGGIMGIGSRRVMGLGLPLLQALSVSEVRAVVAHEFGHFHGGDTRLGPWIYKTRAAIGRTLENLRGQEWLQVPFRAYAGLFLRLTLAVSRRQEYTADALASKVAGAQPLISGLRKIRGAALAFGPYWQQEVGPVLGVGVLPPFAEGFRRFLAHDRVRPAIAEAVTQSERDSATDPFDTHPCLKDRIAALGGEAEVHEVPDQRPAVSMLAGEPLLERALLGGLVESGPDSLRAVSWEDIGEAALVPSWQGVVRENASLVRNLTVDDVPAKARGWAPRQSVQRDDHIFDEGAERATRRFALAASFGLALRARGYRVHSQPGDPVTLEAPDGSRFDPFAQVEALAAGHMKDVVWVEQCRALGITGMPLEVPPVSGGG